MKKLSIFIIPVLLCACSTISFDNIKPEGIYYNISHHKYIELHIKPYNKYTYTITYVSSEEGVETFKKNHKGVWLFKNNIISFINDSGDLFLEKSDFLIIEKSFKKYILTDTDLNNHLNKSEKFRSRFIEK